MKKKILDLMKPKCAKLGFSKEEMEQAAEKVAATFTEESTDEEINAGIDAVMPYLELAQSQANRVINASKQGKPAAEPTGSGSAEPSKPEGSEKNPGQSGTDIASIVTSAVQAAVKPLQDEINTLKTAETSKSLHSTVLESLKDVDADFYKPFIEGQQFTSQEEADAFVSKTLDGWKTFSEKHAAEGLSFTPPGKAGGKGDDIDNLVSVIQQGTKDKFEKQ